MSFVDKGESESTNEHRDETNAELGRSRRDTPKATDLVVCSPPWFSEKSARKLKEFIQPGGVLRVSRYPLRYQSDRNYNGDGFFFCGISKRPYLYLSDWYTLSVYTGVTYTIPV